MKRIQQLEAFNNLVYVITFVAAVLLLTKMTYGYQSLFKVVLLIGGPLGIGLGAYLSKNNEKEQAFNPLFWIGITALFIGMVMKVFNFDYHYLALLGGAAITGISYFFNPLKKETAEDDELLDR